MRKRWTIRNILHALLPAAAGTTMRAARAMGQGEKFLLCRPRGGLNDTLCQIEKCWKYAEQSSRTLLIDSTRSGLLGEFSEFFQPREGAAHVHFHVAAPQLNFLNSLSCHPQALRGKLKTYQPTYAKEIGNYIDRLSGTRLGFDFDKNYDESVLLHEQCGGGTDSFALFDRLCLADDLRPLVLERLCPLGQNYLALHVRNTDYKTEYADFFREIYPRVANKPLLVCSDDDAVIAHARAFFGQSKILTTRLSVHSGDRPLHFKYKKRGSDEQRRQAAIDTIVDLIALGRADELYFTNVTAGFPSGFSMLAEYLCRHKSVVHELLEHPAPNIATRK